MRKTVLSTILLLLIATVAWTQEAGHKDEPEGKKTEEATMPKVAMKTSLGTIVLELDAKKAPITVTNFLLYAQDGYYDGTVFHRVMQNFMIQGGGYTKDLDVKKKGLRPGIENEWRNGLSNKRGTIAMARLPGSANSATSQFFINVVDNLGLDRPRDGAGYCVFGHVAEGMDVVDKIRKTTVTTNPKLPMGKVVPETPVVIESVKLINDFKPDEKIVKELRHQAMTPDQLIAENIARIEKQTGKKFTTTPSGLRYLAAKEGEGASPKPTDRVEVDYTGWLLNGKKFDSSKDRGKPATFALNRVIKGWTEGVGMMKPGGTAWLIIPPDLAYGAGGRPGSIPGNSTLVFEIELHAVNPPAKK